MVTINTRLGPLTIEQTFRDEVIHLVANLQTTEPILTGFIQTQTMDYSNDASQDYDVHRTGIKLHPFFQADDVPLTSLGYPANLAVDLAPLEQSYPKVRITIRSFLVEVTEDQCFRYVAGFAWGYEKARDWQPLPIQELTEAAWQDAMARLNYESPTFCYTV